MREARKKEERRTEICKNYFDPTPSPGQSHGWNVLADFAAQPIAELPDNAS